MSDTRKNLTQLRKMLKSHFNIAELRVLCFDLGIDYEELEGSTKTTKMQDLILFLERHGKLQQLIEAVKEERPGVNWPDMSEEAPKSALAGDNYVDEKTGLEMLRIPAGEFLYREDKRVDYLLEYWISKTPVTNRHYVRFVRATDYEPPKHWKGPSPPSVIADHPVRFVDLHDANAYANWAGMQLPTEQEWEKAARGIDGRAYPWGDTWRGNHCNTRDTGIRDTTPVGEFSPQGDSPYGCVDMAGNVWEWTDSWYDDEKKGRVLRGGSWYFSQDVARAVARRSNLPVNRGGNIGFRVVRRPSSQ